MDKKIKTKKLWKRIIKGIWEQTPEADKEYTCKHCGTLGLIPHKSWRKVCFQCGKKKVMHTPKPEKLISP